MAPAVAIATSDGGIGLAESELGRHRVLQQLHGSCGFVE
jgi:hypothetical protein